MRTQTVVGLAVALTLLYLAVLVVAGQELYAAGLKAAPVAPPVATSTPSSPRLPYDPAGPYFPPLPAPPVPTPPSRPWWPSIPTPTPSLPSAPTVVTWSNSGGDYRMTVSQQFHLDLGSPYYAATSSDPTVLRLLPWLRPLPEGNPDQIYEAVSPGTATLVASSRYRCPPGAMCVQPAIAQRLFQITVRVDQ